MQNTALEKLKLQREQLNARIKDAEAKERKQNRKNETRRKIIIGAIAQAHSETHPASEFTAQLIELLNTHVTKPIDRELLGLKPNNPINTDFTKHATTQ
jgi:predicted  nucleic acid-binding Zn-ribbon protein